MASRRIEIVSGIGFNETSVITNFNNLLCCSPCQQVTITAQNVHNTSLTLSDILVESNVGWSASILEINGAAVSYPYTIAVGATFTITFEICNNETPTSNYWKFSFITTEHGVESVYYIGMNCVELLDLISPSSIDFGTVPSGAEPSLSLTITNTTIGEIPYEVILDDCPTLTGTSLTGSIAAGASASSLITWSAGGAGDAISCSININSGRSCGTALNVTGNVAEITCDPADCLCCIDVFLETDEGYLSTINDLCNYTEVINSSSFLDKKKLVFQFQYAAGIFSGWQLQFNANLFDSICDSPFETNSPLPVGYSLFYAESLMPNGSSNVMALVGAGSNAMNQQNFEVVFRPVDAALGFFNLEFTFYMIQDFENYVSALLFDNSRKLTRNSIFASSDYTNTFTSVYNANKILHSAFFITDPVHIVEGDFTRCSYTHCLNFTSRFYNRGLYNAASEFTVPVFTLSRAIGTVVNLSTVEPTKVTFQITIDPVYLGAAAIVFHMFDETLVDQTQNFLAATDSSRSLITTIAGAGVLDNHLIKPSTFTSLGGNVYEASCYIDTTVNVGSTYRVAAIVYASDGITVNTFISTAFKVTRLPEINCDCTPTIESTFDQYYQRTITECIQPVAKERIKHSLSLTGADFITCLENWGFAVEDWRFLLGLITLRIYKKRNDFPSIGQTTFFQYEQHTSIRSAGFSGGWFNQNDMIVQDSGTDEITVSINDRRVRYQDVPFAGSVFLANTATYMQRNSVVGLTAASYINTLAVRDQWTNEEVFFEYTFTFNLSALVGQPFLWNIVKAFKVQAIDFESNNSGFASMLTDVLIEGKDKITGLYSALPATFCATDYADIRLTYQATEEGDFIFMLEESPFGIATLQENNATLSPTGLTTLTSGAIISQDAAFDPMTLQAQVVIDSNFFANNRYNLCGYISTPPAVLTCEYFNVNAKTGGSRITMIPSIQTGDSFTVGFDLVGFRYLYASTRTNVPTSFPVTGETYKFEYSFDVPTTIVMEFWFGQWSYAGAPTVVLPIGTTSGSVYFVWGADSIGGRWTLRAVSSTPYTATGTFKIGNDLC